MVACAGSEAPPAPAAPAVTLRLHGGSAGAEGDYWPQVVERFNARGGRFQAAFEPWAPDTGPVVLSVAGTLGDVLRVTAFGDFSQVAVKGVLKDVGPLVAREKYDLSKFYPAAVETLRFRNTLFGLPHIAHPGFCGIFVNRDVLRQAGIPEPDDSTWTLDAFRELGRQLSAAGRGSPGAWGLWPPTAVQHVLVAARAYGGDTLSRDGKRALLAEPAGAQGVQLLADLIHKDRVVPAPGTLPGRDLDALLAGQVAMLWTNFGIINALTKQAQGVQWRTLLAPKGPQGRGFFMGVDAASMSAASKYPDGAFELVKHVVSREISLGWFDVGFAPGGRPDTWNDPKVTADPAFKVFARAMAEAGPLRLPDNGLITDFNAALTRELTPVWTGQIGARDGAEAARRAGQDVLDRAAA